MKWPRYLRILQLTCSIVILFTSLQTLKFCLLTVPIFCSHVLTLDHCQEKKNHSSDCNKVMICNFSHHPSKNTCPLSHAPKQLLQFLDSLLWFPLHHLLPSSFPSAFNEQFSHLIRRGNRDHGTQTQLKNHHMNGFGCTPYIITIWCFSFSPENYFHKNNSKYLHRPH